MGEVYRARDTRLNRDVALKVLPEVFGSDPDRLSRFQREAQVLASLNHSNIAMIHGFEETEGVRALVLELVEGETLADRMARGPIGVDEALPIIEQIARALDAAHEHGIIHRDLKPANIKLRPDGTVKVLDFGLAKALEPESGSADISQSPTITSPAVTRVGMILGTAAYMSPEQVRGEAVDRRTDIWAFGVVLFEMLTGVPLFARQTVADTMAAVLHVEPDWSKITARTRPLVRACLQKNARQRLHDIADGRLLLDHNDAGAVARGRVRSSWLPWIIAAAFAIVAAVGWTARRVPPPAQPVRFQITAPGDLPPSAATAISPNGRYLAFLASGSDRVMRVWVRDLETLEDRPLQGAEIGQAAPPPFWSPDSRFIAYDAGGTLKKVDVSGGLAQTICELRQPAVGGSWNREGVILFGNVTGGIMRVSEGGGMASPVTVLESSRGENSHLAPVFLPDGRHFFYLRASRSNPERTGIFLGSLEIPPDQQNLQRLVPTTTSSVYAPPADGQPGTLLFLRDGNLMAQTFDDRRLELSGTPVLVAEQVHSFLDTSTVSASENGVLVYKNVAENSRLTWLDRQGRVTGHASDPGLYSALSLSPDGRRAVVARVNAQVTSSAALWLFDFANPRSTLFAPRASGGGAIWSPDGNRIAFTTSESNDSVLLEKSTSGTGSEKLLFQSDKDRLTPASWSPDGRWVLYVAVNPKSNSDLWVLSLDEHPKAVPFLRTDAAESQAQFAPTPQGASRWVAFTSNESGRDEVHLRTFPDAQNRQVVSPDGGHSPKWRADGKELFYLAADGMVMAVPISDNPFRAGAPTPLFHAPKGFATLDATGRRGPAPWGVTPDGQRFLLVVPVDAGGASTFTVTLNWRAALAK
jgi:Tol biopolymer transport system component